MDSNGGPWNENNDGVTATKLVNIDTEWREYTLLLDPLVYDAYTGGAQFIDTDLDLSQVTLVFKVDDISDPEVTFYIDAIYYSHSNIDPLEYLRKEYTYQIEWVQLTDDEYDNNVSIVNNKGLEVMEAAGSMQFGQVTSTPVTDSYFGTGNALNYVNDGVDSLGGVFFNGISDDNDLTDVTAFKIAIKGGIPPELTCWDLKVQGGNGTEKVVNFMLYEVDSFDPEWRLFEIPAAEYSSVVELDAFSGLGLWNPKQGLDLLFEGDMLDVI